MAVFGGLARVEEVEPGLVLIDQDVRGTGVVLDCDDLVADQFDGPLGDQGGSKAQLLRDGPKPIGPVGRKGEAKGYTLRFFRCFYHLLVGRVVQRSGRVGRGLGRFAHELKPHCCGEETVSVDDMQIACQKTNWTDPVRFGINSDSLLSFEVEKF